LKRVDLSYEAKSHQVGHKNSQVYKQIHGYINYLVSINLIPKEAVVGRLSIGSYTRTALAMDIKVLSVQKELIMNALEDRFDIDDAEEVYRVLEAAVIFAGYNGLIEMTTITANAFIDIYGALPKAIQCNLLNSRSAKQHILDNFKPND
jgi:hypothetical protein